VREYEFDQDIVVERVEPGVFAGRLSDRWNIGSVPNGGYVLAVALAAVRQTLPAPDPLTVTAHYLRPSAPGPVEVHVETIKIGRQYSTASARLLQNGEENARVLATYGDLSAQSGTPTHVFGTAPELPPRDAATAQPNPGFTPPTTAFARRVEIRQGHTIFDPLRPGETPELTGWLRFTDGRRPDVHALSVIVDAFPPVVFRVLPSGWVPTLELTVHVRARPVSEWVCCRFRTRFIFGGLLEEDGEVWDDNGTLLALSRQLAAVPR
jgi:acyl-CoA thioesterase